ncbi:MAG: hypothetical protein LC620_01540 [Halobacteriales archaeon]|nr:hypothetical protein [Halobacteriales archaeon]
MRHYHGVITVAFDESVQGKKYKRDPKAFSADVNALIGKYPLLQIVTEFQGITFKTTLRGTIGDASGGRLEIEAEPHDAVINYQSTTHNKAKPPSQQDVATFADANTQGGNFLADVVALPGVGDHDEYIASHVIC